MGTIIGRAARLFAKPSFVEGVCRILDLGATLNVYNRNATPEEADSEALESDWFSVGDELVSAMQTTDQEVLAPAK